MADDYPLPAFHFVVFFSGTRGASDTSFQEVAGLASELETEDLVEGGENRFVHRLPTLVRHPVLELKRGIAPRTSPLVQWCQTVLDGGFAKPIESKTVTISLLAEDKQPVRTWTVANAYPTKWEIEDFNSTKNEVAIEKVTLSYSYLERVA